MTKDHVSPLTLQERLTFENTTMVIPGSVPRKFRGYRGQSVGLRTEKQRSAVWLTPDEASSLGVDDPSSLLAPGTPPSALNAQSRVALGNFRHQGHHWVAVIRTGSVQTVLVQQEVFLRGPITRRPLAAHGQIRFLLQKGAAVELLPQEPGQEPYQGPPVDDFIASSEAVPPRIEKFPVYSLYGGARGWYRQCLRFVSTPEKTRDMLDGKNSVNQFLLYLQPGEPPKVLLEALRRALEIGMDLAYNIFAIGGTQCVYEMFNILDRSILDERDNNTFLVKLYKHFDRVPLFVGRYLERRGLRYSEPKNKRFPTLDEELKLSPEELEHLRMKLTALAKVQS
jgi:hypothetical protein